MTKHVHGGNIYTYKNCLDFSANCNPLGTPESVKQAVRDSLEQIKDYPQVGYQPLKEAPVARTLISCHISYVITVQYPHSYESKCIPNHLR